MARRGRRTSASGRSRSSRISSRATSSSPTKPLITALWVVHAHLVRAAARNDALNHTAYLSVTSPEKQCGKTQPLLLLAKLVPEPWPCTLPSEAVAFRHIHANMATMLLDETDAIFIARTSDRYEGLRAILNSGYRTGMPVPRCLGNANVPTDYHVFCAKVLRASARSRIRWPTAASPSACSASARTRRLRASATARLKRWRTDPRGRSQRGCWKMQRWSTRARRCRRS